MATIREFETNEQKLSRLEEEALNKCEALDQTLNQMNLKYSNMRPAEDGLVKGDLKDIDIVLDAMVGIRKLDWEIDKQKEKMGIDHTEGKTLKGMVLEDTMDHMLAEYDANN